MRGSKINKQADWSLLLNREFGRVTWNLQSIFGRVMHMVWLLPYIDWGSLKDESLVNVLVHTVWLKMTNKQTNRVIVRQPKYPIWLLPSRPMRSCWRGISFDNNAVVAANKNHHLFKSRNWMPFKFQSTSSLDFFREIKSPVEVVCMSLKQLLGEFGCHRSVTLILYSFWSFGVMSLFQHSFIQHI